MARTVPLLVLLSVIYRCHGELNTAAFQSQIDSLANNILGVNAFQRYLDEEIVYAAATQTPSQFLEQLSSTLAVKITKRMDAVTLMRDTIQQDFTGYTNTRPFQDCCDCCSVDDVFGRLKFHKKVNTATLCHTGQGMHTGHSQKYPDDGLLLTMKQNFNSNPNLKWQYFGGEDGIMTIYPSNVDCNPKYDPRYRPWYSQTAFATPKDVVIVVDRSGSMGTYDRSGRTLMDLAKEAAVTVVNTLNPDDRVGVIFFNNNIQKYNNGCFSSKLAVANPENKKLLVDNFINRISDSGGTVYSGAFNAAFDYFQTTGNNPDMDDRVRGAIKIILFLTDGQPSDSSYLTTIQQRNQQLNNEVVILTFGFGDGITSHATAMTNLENIARQRTLTGPEQTGVKPGRFILVSDPSNLRYSMARYYDFFTEETPNQEATVSFPYLDAFGLGLITSICLPVHTGGIFRGVTCIDITLSDLFSDATYFSHDANNYAFVVDGQSRLLIHPLLARPSDIFEDPTVLRMLDLEVAPQMADIANNKIRTGVAGEASFSSRRVLSRGDSKHEGVDTISVASQVLWKPIGLANLTLVIVMATDNLPSSVASSPAVTSFPYHRLDITRPMGTGLCRYLNRIGFTDSSVIKFAPFAFTSPDYYLERAETTVVINSYQEYFMGAGDTEFRDGVKESLGISLKLDDVMNRQGDAWQETVWRYLGTREGVMRVYPGVKFVKKYDPTVRTWYKRALAQKDKHTLSWPYVDAFGAGIIVTLSKALYEPASNFVHGRDDAAVGVMGMDFTLDLFNSLLINKIPQCNELSCFVIDIAGYILSHPDFVTIPDENFHEIENVHIIAKEPSIASSLFEANILNKDRCINFANHYVQTFWRIGGTRHITAEYELHAVSDANIYVIVKKAPLYKNTCSCSSVSGSDIRLCTNTACECPCYNRNDVRYDQCSTTFDFDTEVGSLPPCTPDVPFIDLASVANEEIDTAQDYDYCYPVTQICPGRETDLNCSATAGCQWCNNLCQPRGGQQLCNSDEVTSEGGGSNYAGIIAGVVVVVIIVIVAIGVFIYLKKRAANNASRNRTDVHTSPGRAQVYENRAMEPEPNSRPPPTAPHYGMADPGPHPYEPPPKYNDVA